MTNYVVISSPLGVLRPLLLLARMGLAPRHIPPDPPGSRSLPTPSTVLGPPPPVKMLSTMSREDILKIMHHPDTKPPEVLPMAPAAI